MLLQIIKPQAFLGEELLTINKVNVFKNLAKLQGQGHKVTERSCNEIYACEIFNRYCTLLKGHKQG